MKILIDNGHGEETPGKCSPDKTLREYQWNREVSNMICDILQAEGYDAELLVPEIWDVSLGERCSRANKFNKRTTILISVHVNASSANGSWRSAHGWSVYTTRGITAADQLAECIWNSASRTFKSPLTVRSYSNQKLGHDFEAEFYILLHTYCPAVLIENFFMDNTEDCEYLKTDEGKVTCAEVAVEGIKDFLAMQG